MLQTYNFDHHSSSGISEETSQQPKEIWVTNLLPTSNQKQSAHKTPDTSQKGTPQLTNHQSRHLKKGGIVAQSEPTRTQTNQNKPPNQPASPPPEKIGAHPNPRLDSHKPPRSLRRRRIRELRRRRINREGDAHACNWAVRKA